ncbi:peptidase [Nocardia sp. NPDC059177]|uniref:peptidase n=1 Tax=Nocardia sp. NPDC059177 TaxID=3346759 RepID=UPI0036AF1309
MPPIEGTYWRTAPQTDAQRAEVATRSRLIDVCALVPRAELASIGTVRTVDNDQTDSCRVEFASPDGTTDKLSWASMVVFTDAPQQAGTTVTQLGAADLSVLPGDLDRSGTQQTCHATAKFPAGAAIYFQTTTPDGLDACARLEALAGNAMRQWMSTPPQGTSPDTKHTVLHGADPCAVRDRLDGATPLGAPTLKACGFNYRGVDVIVSYEHRERTLLSKNEQTVDGRTVYTVDRSLTAVVGPDQPPGTTGFGGAIVPVVNVYADNTDVAAEVMRHVLPLFPAA